MSVPTPRPGVSRNRALRAAAALCAALFAFAFVAAPHSCEWGLTAYFWSGVACVILAFALPFILDRSASLGRRYAWAFGLALATTGVWFGGLVAANVRIICRLF